MEDILNKYSLLKHQNVPRETLLQFETFIAMVQKENKEINIISRETEESDVIRHRHVIDSAQIIEFIDLNSKNTTDIGSGGGFPGIITSIMLKNKKEKSKIHLYEKSFHKSRFLRKASKDLEINAKVIQENIFEAQNLESGTIISRAFKPLPIVLDLVYKNFVSYKNVVMFMGKTGEKILKETLKIWDFDFEKKKSITSENSFLLNIKNIKKKI
ncbi:16S rRNA m(7)G-527 methyltransferase [Candidatus Pelagibacter ubique]|uniref:Ribosomal RNA small subunit methyltransferase G n=1 Tax=Pelagibacter ubique TaxID=198252 RepID=A0ABX1SZK6_PELUQ|nr:RsmG family class I SAM-dependent methyltransferase [Candidatus Pelagibacter ubique]NMN67283.1 16S rRNA m(7)G-527 methyltransferase [Candidatus Pelagibacter ubique]